MTAFGGPAVTTPVSSPFRTHADRNLRLTHQTLGAGESEHPVSDVLQDTQGFIWIGTNDGLFRIGGTGLTAFRHSRSEARSLTDDVVVDLHLDHEGTLWVATKSGLNRYDPKSEQFDRHLISDAQALIGAELTSVLHDNTGILWVGTRNNGLFAINGESLQHFAAQTIGASAVQQALPNNHVSTLTQDSMGNLWLGTDGGGFARFDRRTEGFVTYRASNDGLSSNRISRIYEDPQRRLWIATSDAGLNLFDAQTQRFTVYRHNASSLTSLSSDSVTDVLADVDGAIWVATHAGLNELTASGDFVRYQTDASNDAGLRSNEIVRLYQDVDGVLWIATDKGIHRWNYLSDAFRYLGLGKRPHRVSAAAQCPNGQLWIGTRSKGVAKLARDTGALEFVASEALKVRALLCDQRNTLWVGTYDAGLLRLTEPADGAEHALVPVNETKPFQRITSLVADAAGIVWVGTGTQGLLALGQGDANAVTVRQFSVDPQTPNSLVDNEVSVLFVDASNRLWVGTGNGNLAQFQPDSNTFASYPLTSDHGDRAATDLLQSKNGDLWIATNGSGLLRWPAEQRLRGETSFTQFTKTNGLSTNHLRGLLEDQAGKLWISSNRGLIRFDPATLKMRVFDKMNGLRGDRFYSAAKLISRSGRLFFGSQQGLVGFDPAAISALKSAPRITLSAHNRSAQLLRTYSHVKQPPELTLNSAQDYIEFRFASLQHVAPGQNQYRYQLEGFDDTWYSPNQAHTATYTSLPAGDYVFRVKTSDPEGIWSADARVALQVLDPFWRSRTAKIFYGLLALAVLGFLTLSWRREVQRLRSSRRNLEIQVEHRTAELEQRNRQLQELNVRLQEASITDPLTGLLNRRSFYEFVSREVARVERSYTAQAGQDKQSQQSNNAERRVLFFMMIDLDEFKPINDNFGHHTGDHTLVQVSELLRACARDADTVFRWGGDEFVVIGQVNQEQDMDLLAERIRSSIAEHRFDPKYGKTLRLSASIGVAPYPFCKSNPGIAAWEQVADVADLAAYLAKTHGKNAWVSTRGADDLTAMHMQGVKDNFGLLIETKKILATSSATTIPIPGATRIQ